MVPDWTLEMNSAPPPPPEVTTSQLGHASRPLLGAALPSSQLSARRDWLMAGRDVELKDAVSHLLLLISA